MPIIFKLVGHINSNALEIKREITGIVKFSSIISIFELYGISSESFEHIRFVIDSETIKDDTKIFKVSNDYNLIVFVFTSNKEIKEKLIEIFLKNEISIFDDNPISIFDDESNPIVNDNPISIFDDESNPIVNDNPISIFDDESNSIVDDIPIPIFDNDSCDEELTKPLVDKIQEDENTELSKEIIESNNIKTAKLFENKDFKHLIRIYYSNPDVIKTFLNFVSHGDIIKISIPIISEEKDYLDEIGMLKSLGINESDDFIKSVLNRFNGHLNLSLRVLLTHIAVNCEA